MEMSLAGFLPAVIRRGRTRSDDLLTDMLMLSAICLQDCGHDAVNDEALFSSTPRIGEAPARPPPGLTGLAFDERMTMHAEQSSAPHPERPDRIRAVIARLQASGLAGRPPNPASLASSLTLCHGSISKASTSSRWDHIHLSYGSEDSLYILCRLSAVSPWMLQPSFGA